MNSSDTSDRMRLQQWAWRYMQGPGSATTRTHRLLGLGWSLCVPDQLASEFNQRYARDVTLFDQYVVECRPATFKMFMKVAFWFGGNASKTQAQ